MSYQRNLRLNHGNSQCWLLAHRHLRNVCKGDITLVEETDPKVLLTTDYKPNHAYVIEIEITDARGGRKRGFFIPRLFLHAFNVFVFEDKIVLRQSWFRKMPYHTFLEFKTQDDFKDWIRYLLRHIDVFKDDPDSLFKVFGYSDFREHYLVHEYMKKTKELVFRVDIYECKMEK